MDFRFPVKYLVRPSLTASSLEITSISLLKMGRIDFVDEVNGKTKALDSTYYTQVFIVGLRCQD